MPDELSSIAAAGKTATIVQGIAIVGEWLEGRVQPGCILKGDNEGGVLKGVPERGLLNG